MNQLAMALSDTQVQRVVESNQSTVETLEQQVARLTAENERLKSAKPKPRELSWKVSQKGAVSIYGLGRWPVTVYYSQFKRLLEYVSKPEVQAEIELAHDTGLLKDKE